MFLLPSTPFWCFCNVCSTLCELFLPDSHFFHHGFILRQSAASQFQRLKQVSHFSSAALQKIKILFQTLRTLLEGSLWFCHLKTSQDRFPSGFWIKKNRGKFPESLVGGRISLAGVWEKNPKKHNLFFCFTGDLYTLLASSTSTFTTRSCCSALHLSQVFSPFS